MVETKSEFTPSIRSIAPDTNERERQRVPLATRYSLLATSLCGFVAVFGIAHLLLIDFTKPSGYVFFGTLAVGSSLIAVVLYGFARDRRAMLMRFGFGSLMCVCAVPVVYLARFAPESARSTVRNLLGLPFLILALIGPGLFRRTRRRITGA